MTITTATSSRSFTISSSITCVDCGSSAEHGSSSSSTSGCGGERAGDAEPLLLAAGEPQRGVVEVVGDLVEQAGALERVAHRGPAAPRLRGRREACSRST